MAPLDGKTAIVTGASSGIGAATARALQEAGARVGVGARRDLERGRGTQWDPNIVEIVLRLIETDAISFSSEGLLISQVLPRRAAGAVLGFLDRKSRDELLGRQHEAAQ